MDEISKLSLLRGRSFEISKNVFLKHPTMGDIEELGEEKYCNLVSPLITSSKDIADILWVEGKIWYEDIKSEWAFFLEKEIANAVPCDVCFVLQDGNTIFSEALRVSQYLADSLNFFYNRSSEYVFVAKENDDGNQILITEVSEDGYVYEDGFKFGEHHYYKTTAYLREINWIKSDYEFLKGGSRAAKQYILKNNYKKRKRKIDTPPVDLESIFSSLVAKGVSYKEIWEWHIYAFYDCYYRHVKIGEYNNTVSALYAGAIDTKKHPVDWDKINWASVLNN